MEHIINMPRYITASNMEDIIRVYNNILLKVKPKDSIIWYFRSVKSIETAGLVLLAAINKKLLSLEVRQNVFFDAESKDVIHYMERMDYFRLFNVTAFPNMRRNNKDTVLCEVCCIENEDQVNTPIHKLRKIIKEQTKINALEVATSELVMNTMHHGGNDTLCYVAAQTRGGCVNISICDTGIGIYESLQRANAYGDIQNDAKAIQLALQRFITGNISGERANSGMGLSICKEIFTRNAGQFVIWSGEGKYTLCRGIESFDNNRPKWNGTMIDIQYRLNKAIDISDILGHLDSDLEDNQFESIFR